MNDTEKFELAFDLLGRTSKIVSIAKEYLQELHQKTPELFPKDHMLEEAIDILDGLDGIFDMALLGDKNWYRDFYRLTGDEPMEVLDEVNAPAK